MRCVRWSSLLLLVNSIAGAQTGLPPEVLLLSRIKRNVADTLNRLPSYACLENIDRLVRESPRKAMHGLDALRLEVVVNDGQELFSWPDDQSAFGDALAIPGLSSTGQFFSTAKGIFTGGSAAIKYHGEETLQGVRAARYDYTLSLLFSSYEMTVNGRHATVASSGSFWADPSTAELLRITQQADDIPPDLDTLSATDTIDYSRLLLGGKPFLFPQTAVVTLVRAKGAESRNRIEFTHCREYRVESHLSTGGIDAAPVPATVEFQIPPGLVFPVSLSDAIDLTQVRVGDQIRGVLDRNVAYHGGAIAPKGALLTGRVRILVRNHERNASFMTLGCEFTDLWFTDSSGVRHHAPFYAFPRGITPLPGVTQQISNVNSRRIDALGLSTESIRTESLTPLGLPGVGTFFVENGRTVLPKGFGIDWISARFPHGR
jgi:hypothetical protein